MSILLKRYLVMVGDRVYVVIADERDDYGDRVRFKCGGKVVGVFVDYSMWVEVDSVPSSSWWRRLLQRLV